MSRTIAVVGAGAAGCMAALSAAMNRPAADTRILLLESSSRIGAKIRVTGNGRCNLSNLEILPEHYFSVGSSDPMPVFRKFSPQELRTFFEERGVFLHNRGKLIYPLTDRAETIAGLFERELEKEKVQILTDTRIRGIRTEETGYVLRAEDGREFREECVILSCGGLAGRNLGCEGDGYELAGQMGLTATACFPALTYLKTDCAGLTAADGVRCTAAVSLYDGTEKVREEAGELQLTRRGLSGIVIFQLSHPAAALIRKSRETFVVIDFAPEVSREQLLRQIRERMKRVPDENPMLSELFFGMIHPGAAAMIIRSAGQVEERRARKLHPQELEDLLMQIKSFRVRITGTGGYEDAQVTAGGVSMSGLTENLEAVSRKGLYLCGELLDVDGLCGGYNLTFAMCSGAVCGRAAAQAQDERSAL